MLDNRITTFLTLCNTMNYRKTAQALNMTQPAVTQQMKYLEKQYGCRLFEYANRTLRKTEKCVVLEQSARSIAALSLATTAQLSASEKRTLRIGATKTIGEYTLGNMTLALLADDQIDFHLTINNTETLLAQLNALTLDLLLIEGYIDKTKYDYLPIRTAELIGICAPDHPFAGQEVTLPALYQEKIILREQGSGTRAVLESFLHGQNSSLAAFGQQATINSYPLIEQAVASGLAVSFVYDVIPQQRPNLATFHIKEQRILHEFNYVFLKNTNGKALIAQLPPCDAAVCLA